MEQFGIIGIYVYNGLGMEAYGIQLAAKVL